MIPTHLHSEYSALDGFAKPIEIAARLEELGLPGAFLTDHGTVAGLEQFAKALKKKDLWVGYGMEAYQSAGSRTNKTDPETGKSFKRGQDSYHLILLAKNQEGYRNLLRISDEANRTGFHHVPRLDLDLLEKHHEGLICTSACAGSWAVNCLQKGEKKPIYDLADIFGEDFYIEIHTYDTDEQREINKELISLANSRGYPLVVATDAHYMRPDEFLSHEAVLCAQYNTKLDADKGERSNHPEDPNFYHPECLYVMSEEEVRERLSYLKDSDVDQAIGNTDLLMEMCSFEVDKPGLYLPKFKPEEGFKTSEEMIEHLVIEGLLERYGDEDGTVPQEVVERAEFELNAIVEAGLQDYFLIVWDYINHALRHGIMVGPGRGSVGGSILAYALGITTIDPLKHNLQFERFWNPGRADGLPDIDVDFEQSARQFMIEYAKRKYGENAVLPIGNHIFIRPKSAIDKAGMVLYKEPPYGKMAAIKKIIETTTDAGQQKPWNEMWDMLGEQAEKKGEEHPLESFEKELPELFELASVYSGRLGTYGVHASAVVISEIDINDRLPARMASDDDKRKVLVTQAEMHGVEDAGFPKFDFLGLRNLDTIVMAAILSGDFGDPDVLGPKLFKLIEERQQGEILRADKDLREALVKVVKHLRNEVYYDTLPDSYWEQVDKGHTLGFFQIEESSSPRRIGKQLRPRSIEDLAFIVALNRPGPLRDLDEDGRSTVDRFLARRNGEEEVKYPHPFLEGLLEPTYGDFLYQEQVIGYFREIGYSLSDADHIRKILGKKLVKEMDAQFPIYMGYAEQVMPKQTAKAVWDKIQEFSKYSFNKAHAVGYGTILAWTMYAKWKWPVEFVMASIATNPKKVAQYIGEGRRMGVHFRSPNVNESLATIAKAGDSIMYGLRDIKGIGEDAAQWIVDNAPYESPEDFYRKAAAEKPVVVKANHRQALMDAGAFDGFGYRLVKCEDCAGKGRRRIDPKKRILDDCPDCEGLGYQKVEIPSEKARAALEEELLGTALTDLYGDIIERNREELEALDELADADIEEDGKEFCVPGVVKTIEERKAHWYVPPPIPEKWARVTIEWQGEEITFAAFPEVYFEKKEKLRKGIVGAFTLKTSKKGPQLTKVTRFV